MLVVGMTGVKLGDRIVQIGCAHGGRLGAVAARVGLSGRAVAVAPDAVSAARARKGAEQQGVLLEVEIAPPTRLPIENDAFDLAIIDDTGGLLAAMSDDDRAGTIRETLRILKPGGRLMVIGAVPRRGLGALFTRAQAGSAFEPQSSLETQGFKFIRILAEREGLRFTEAIKGR